MSEIERFGWSGHGMSNYGPPDENSYVRFSDHDAEVTALRATVARLETESAQHYAMAVAMFFSGKVDDVTGTEIRAAAKKIKATIAEQVRT